MFEYLIAVFLVTTALAAALIGVCMLVLVFTEMRRRLLLFSLMERRYARQIAEARLQRKFEAKKRKSQVKERRLKVNRYPREVVNEH